MESRIKVQTLEYQGRIFIDAADFAAYLESYVATVLADPRVTNSIISRSVQVAFKDKIDWLRSL